MIYRKYKSYISMGTVLGTLSYDIPDEIPIHIKVIQHMQDEAKKHRLNPFSVHEDFTIIPGKEKFSVDLNGFTLWWVGKETAIKRIDEYLLKMKKYLQEQGFQNVEIAQTVVVLS